MTSDYRELVNGAVRAYDQAKTLAFRRFQGVVSLALGMPSEERGAALDDAWRGYCDELQSAGSPMSLVIERLARR